MRTVEGIGCRVIACAAAYAVLAGCATPGAPDRARVATQLADRTRVDTGGLVAPREWTAPPGVAIADGLAIDEAVAVALWNNADFHLALASLGLARADLIEAGLLRNPILSLLFPWGPKQFEFTLSWSIDALWHRPRRIEDARLNAEASAEQLVASGLRLTTDVKIAFLDAVSAERALAVAVEQSQVAAKAAAAADVLLRAGDISELEARLARTDAVRLETLRLTRLAARDLGVLRLRALLTLPPDAAPLKLVEPPIAISETCSTGPDLLKSALAARPEVRAAELQLEAAGARAGLERLRIFTLTASLDANAQGKEGFEMGPGLAGELPILSQNQGRRARALAEVDQAGRRYLAVRATVAAQVAESQARLAEARAAADLLGNDLGASLATARQQAQRLFDAGEVSLLSLLQIRQRLMDIEATRVEAVFGVNRALVRLEDALGRSCAVR